MTIQHLLPDFQGDFFSGQHRVYSLHTLPAYAPNLNLIERLWRFVKGKLVRNRYYEKYKTFRSKVFILLKMSQERQHQTTWHSWQQQDFWKWRRKVERKYTSIRD